MARGSLISSSSVEPLLCHLVQPVTLWRLRSFKPVELSIAGMGSKILQVSEQV